MLIDNSFQDLEKQMDTIVQTLFNEFSQWYSNLVEQHGRVPKAVSGVSSSGDQFIFILDGLRLDHVERNNLVIQTLEEEGAIVFAYASLFASYDEDTDITKEVLAITAGTSEIFMEGSWSVLRDDDGTPQLQHIKTFSADDPENYPNSWFLTSSHALSKNEGQRSSEMWKTLRKDAQFIRQE